jgi:AbrB family looped-hinge helix DNA binding protein
MQTRVSPKGEIVIPASIRRKLGIRAGDLLHIAIEQDRIVLSLSSKPRYKARIMEDPITGFTVIDVGPDAPILTSEMVRELLSDFP